MCAKRSISVDDMKALKSMLWEGKSQNEAAVTFNITQAYVSNIYRGISYREVPWPDGSTGPMPIRSISSRQTINQSDQDPNTPRPQDVKIDYTAVYGKDLPRASWQLCELYIISGVRPETQKHLDEIQKNIRTIPGFKDAIQCFIDMAEHQLGYGEQEQIVYIGEDEKDTRTVKEPAKKLEIATITNYAFQIMRKNPDLLLEKFRKETGT